MSGIGSNPLAEGPQDDADLLDELADALATLRAALA
jgi:hypothetical protein